MDTRYLLDPYALEWKNDHYYLIGYSHKHSRVAHFRVDRLAGVDVLTTEFAQLENFDVAAYTNTMIDMFASEGTLDVELLCDNELMRVIIDHYGENVPVRTYDKDRFIATIKVNPSGTFYGWVFKFMGKIKILSPQECVNQMRNGSKGVYLRNWGKVLKIFNTLPCFSFFALNRTPVPSYNKTRMFAMLRTPLETGGKPS